MEGTKLSADLDQLPEPYRTVLGTVSSEAGRAKMSVYLAGGIVRDLLLKQPVKDLDLVVEGDAIRLSRRLAKLHGGKVTSHPRFGTATWQLPPDLLEENGTPATLDLATARKETYPFAGALPVVEFAAIRDDLGRRDFTINAMALGLEGGRPRDLLDPFGGRQDLKRGVIRTLHEHSFLEDPTRMLRALRYARRFGFELAPGTRSQINGEALDVLAALSGERLRHELDLTLEEEHPAGMLQEAERLGLLSAIDEGLPGFKPAYESMLASATAPALRLETDRRLLGYLLWLVDLSPETLSRLSRRLAFDGKLARGLREGAILLRDLPVLRGQKASAWTARLDGIPLIAVQAVLLRTGEPALDTYLRTWRTIFPITSGNDLKRRGLEPGPIFRKILSQLRAARLDGEITSPEDESALLDRLLKEG